MEPRVTEQVEASFVRISTADGPVRGAGFLVSEGHVLTCAHVVAAALGIEDDTAEKPRDTVHLDFPFLDAAACTALVEHWQPRTGPETNPSGDIAVLRLTEAPPDAARPARLTAANGLFGRKFRAYGYPEGHDAGVNVYGVLHDRLGNGWLQVGEDLEYPGKSIQPGFSGAPIEDRKTGGIMGMAVAKTGDQLGFVIPTEMLARSRSNLTIVAEETWDKFRIRCEEKSRSVLERTLKKRENELEDYVPRLEAQAHIERFVKSKNSTFLVITGESGIGKTSLLHSTIKSLYNQTDHAFIVYSATDLDQTADIIATIGSELKDYLERKDYLESNEDPFKLLKEHMLPKGRLFIIAFDAINESINYKEIIRQLEKSPKLYRSVCPWIKIIMTCRPHVWQDIRSQGIISPGRYYGPAKSNQRNITLERFTTDEAAQAYERYRELFHFEGPSFVELSPHLQQPLRDPLLLRLIAEMYREEHLPEEISALDINIVPEYMKYLQEEEEPSVLNVDDIAFLKQDISPLILDSNPCESSVSSNAVLQPTRRGWDNRNIRKESLARLLEAGILIETSKGTGASSKSLIKYRYERFQDYYLGELIHNRSYQYSRTSDSESYGLQYY